MATFNEMRAPTSRKYVTEEGIMILDLLHTLQCFWLHSSVFAKGKYPKNLVFQSLFFTSKTSFTPTFRKYFTEQDISMPNLLQTLQLVLVALLCFCLRKVA